MPFQSEKQRRYLWANEPKIARDWTDTYGSRIEKNDGGIMRTGFFKGAQADTAKGHAMSPGTSATGGGPSGPTGGAGHGRQDNYNPNTYKAPPPKKYQQTKGDYLDKKEAIIKAKEKEPSFFTKLKHKHDAKRRQDFYKKYMKQNPQFFSNPLFNKELAGLEDWESWDEEKWNDPTTRSMLDKLGYLNTGNMNQGGGGGGYRGYPSYEAWLAAQGGGGITDVTEVIEEEPISDFQKSIAGGPDLPFKDYYVGGDPTAANIAWGKDRVDPRTMGQTSFAAHGGRIPAAFGGIMDSSTGRRGYFLGSIGDALGSVAKAAKKVLGSKVGKAALLGGLGMYGANAGWFGGGGGGGGSGLFGNLKNKLFMKHLSGKGAAAKYGGLSYGKLATMLAPALAFTGLGDVPDDVTEDFDHDLLKKQYADEILRIKKESKERALDPNEWNYLGVPEGELPFKDGGRTGYYAGGQSTPSDYTMEDAMMTTTQDKLGGITDVMKQADLNRQGSVGQFYAANGGSADAKLMARIKELQDEGLDYNSARAQAEKEAQGKAQGGRIGADEGGLMDLGGMEKDYRNDGGFVPLGGEEKADDVPARLSKNEFVFTADAVRGAGDGDIDKGAEIMENIMKNLEQGGQISEETQGLTGAQEMFGVSERLSEVV